MEPASKRAKLSSVIPARMTQEDIEAIEEEIEEWEEKWKVGRHNLETPADVAARVEVSMSNFDVKYGAMSVGALKTIHEKEEELEGPLIALLNNLPNITDQKALEKFEMTVERAADLKRRVNNILEVMYNSAMQLSATIRTHWGSQAGHVGLTDEQDTSLNRFMRVEPHSDKLTPYQRLLLYLLGRLHHLGYKRYEGDCYRPVYVDNFFTRSFERVCTIDEFVHKQTQKEVHFEMWKAITAASDNAKKACDYLITHNDREFATLLRDRHIFSFRNGLWFTNVVDENTGEVSDKFHPYKDEEDVDMMPDVVACNFFNREFDDYADRSWEDIMTPSLQKIVDDQGFDRESSRWLYIMIGRMMYDVGEHDGWQVKSCVVCLWHVSCFQISLLFALFCLTHHFVWPSALSENESLCYAGSTLLQRGCRHWEEHHSQLCHQTDLRQRRRRHPVQQHREDLWPVQPLREVHHRGARGQG